ncbi:MAG TPA: SpoVA/SpoVAEb family sporulation membrane protein [Clostridiales bacterium]|nr:SpoVA/SpoVAEb family sporulation membrane protein [Clostridiales bacterium]
MSLCAVRLLFYINNSGKANNNSGISFRQVIPIYKKDYKKYAEKTAQKSNVLVCCIKAFLVGGAICTFAQWLYNMFITRLGEENTRLLVPVVLIFLTALTTGLGWFDKLAKHAGGGTLVPITGFANAISSAAIDSKNEGWVLGLGSKIFTIAGPVILYGTLASVIYGVVLYLLKLAGAGGA